MKRILILGAALLAVGATAGTAGAGKVVTPVPFPAATAGPVFIAAQTVTTDGAMTNYFAPGSTVVFRAYAVVTKSKTLVDPKNVRYFYVSVPNAGTVKLKYNPKAPGATQSMPWVGTWTIPSSYAAGNVPIDIRIKLFSHETGQFVQMPVLPAMLTVSSTPPTTFEPAPTGNTGLSNTSKIDLSLYVDTVNGTRPAAAAPRQVGCSQTNVYKRGEQVVFRSWGMNLNDGTLLTTDNVKTAVVQIPGVTPDLTLNYGAHGAVQFWSTPWNLPTDFPLGTTVAHVVYTTIDGKTGSFDYALNIIP
ncbi:MAG: hypothetical protein JOZ56_06325 [Actinobacteria bacterium]|nr:hypothetical protein [Actinomycetota bacterium]MBV8562689.1 hypothetical protein [Actinomycetota bacterium]